MELEATPQTLKKASPSSEKKTSSNVVSHTLHVGDHRCQVLLTTCQVRLTASDASTTLARALLDSASSTSFMTECLAQGLHLPQQHCPLQISGIGRTAAQTVSRDVMNF